MEIEKKYIVEKTAYLDWFPNVVQSARINQYYLNDMNDQWLVRLRSYGSLYYLTLKTKGLLSREELEFRITEQEFEKAVILSKKHLGKIRFIVELSNYPGVIFEIDKYDSYDFLTCEVEFKTEEEAKAFVPPSWCIEDITEDPKYKNINLAK